MAIKRRSNPGVGDIQQPLNQGDLCPSAGRQPTYASTPSDWTQIAKATIASFMQVVNCALSKAIGAKADTEQDVARLVARECLQWRLPPQLFHSALTFVIDYCRVAHEEKDAIADFFQQFTRLQYPGMCYEVFHHGQFHIYYDELPTEVFDLKKTVLFWIDHSKTECCSRGEPLSKNETLEPKAEAMLRFLCWAEHAGRVVTFEKLYLAVWGRPGSSNANSIANAINVRQNAINRFGDEKFIVKAVNSSSTPADKKISRLHGQGAYLVAKHAYEELCIIRSVRRER